MTRAVLTFHSIDDSGSVLSFAPASLARLLQSLRRSQIPVVSYPELLRQPRGVCLTFDDGARSVFDAALPILRQFAAPAHLFVVPGHVAGDNRWRSQPAGAPRFELMDWGQIETCARAGLSVEGHGMTHPDLCALPDDEIEREAQNCDDAIRSRTGVAPTLFAYPYGRHSRRVRDLVAPRYAACFTTRLATLPTVADASAVPRVDSYYLQARLWLDDPLGLLTRGYLGLRAALRRARGAE